MQIFAWKNDAKYVLFFFLKTIILTTMSYLSGDVLSEIQATYARNRIRSGQDDPIELEIRFGEYSIPPNQVTYFDRRTQSERTRYDTRREITNITYSRFLKKLTGTPIITDVTDCSMGDIRRSVDNQTGEITWIRKKSLYRQDNRNYRIRVSMSSENPISPVTDFNPQYTRRKLRRSYMMPTGFRLDLTEVTSGVGEDLTTTYEVEAEATRRNLTEMNFNMTINFILSVIQDTELVYTDREYFDVINYVNASLEGKSDRRIDDKVLYQPRNLHYNDLVYGGIVGNPNEIYKVTWKTDGIRKLLVMSPKGIWLVWAPNQVNLLTRWVNDRLTGTILEGEHVPLNDRYLRHPTKSRMKYTDWYEINKSPNPDKSQIDGYELVPSQKYWFLAFDALSRPFDNMSERGDDSIQTRTHRERMDVAQYFIDLLYDRMDDDPRMNDFIRKIFTINTKEFKAFKNPPEFFSVMREFNALASTLAYDIDGYIFMPDNMPYNSGNDKKPLKSRVLTKFADICKFKPADEMTIDFALSWKDDGKHVPPLESSCAVGSGFIGSRSPITTVPMSNRKLQLMVSVFNPATRRSYSSQYQGSNIRKLDDDMIDMDNPLTQNVPSGTVVEYRWDKETKKLTPTRIRYDKKFPNRIEIANDNWNLIFDPIELETLLGNNIDLVRKYHNRIKKELFNGANSRYQEKSGSLTLPNLLDIGSGWGGDITKWKPYNKIIAVEPNLNHIQEGLIPRIQLFIGQPEVAIISKMEDIDLYLPEVLRRDDKVIIINSGGQDTDLITTTTSRFLERYGGKANVVSMMLSLSFFWESSLVLQSLVDTVGKNLISNGEFIFLTINGDTVEELFNPKFGNGHQIEGLLMGPRGNRTVEMKADIPARKVWINIPGTIVEDQTEWLVKLDDLQVRLEPYGLSLRSLERADKEGFLNQAERVYTNMYSYGSFSPISENKVNRIDEVLVESSSVFPTGKIIPPSKISSITTPPSIATPPSITTPPITSTPPSITTPPLVETIPSSPMQSPPPVTLPPTTLPPTTVPPPTLPPTLTLEPVIITEEAIKTPDVAQTLPYLPVSTTSVDPQGRGIGDDVSQIIPCQWYDQYPVVRIAAIGDGSCFVHSVLKSYNPSYANNPSATNRVKMARELRRDLAFTLQLPDPTNPTETLYQSFNDGIFPEYAKGDAAFSLGSLQKIINSSGWLGDEIFDYATQRLGVNVMVMTPTFTDLVQESGGDIGSLGHGYNIFVGHVGGCHYETLGIYIEGKGIQTVFDLNDPFLIAYHSWRTLDSIRSDLNTIINKIKLYQADIAQQIVGLDLNEFLRSDPIFTQLRNKLNEAQEIYRKSQRLQERAIKGTTDKTLRRLLRNQRKINSIQLEVSKEVG